MAGRRHRIDHDRCLPSLKLVHGPDASTWNTLLKLEYLGVVGRNDKYFFQPYRRLDALAVDPGRLTCQDFCNEVADPVGLLRRRTLINPPLT